MLKKFTTAEVYKIEFFTAEFIKFDKSFTFKFHKINFFSQINKLINKLIFKHMTSSVKNKYKSENKMSSSFLWTEILKIRCRRFSTKKKNIMNLMIMSMMIIKWNESIYHSEFLMLAFLARQDNLLFKNFDIWFHFFWNLKVYLIIQQ